MFALLFSCFIQTQLSTSTRSVYFVWHPIKTGGTSLCFSFSSDGALKSNFHHDKFGPMTSRWNCKLGKHEARFLKVLTNRSYSAENLPENSETFALTGRRFLFFEPSWRYRMSFRSWRLPPFLQPGSLAFLTYRHIFLIREPVSRFISALDFLRLPSDCNTTSEHFVLNFKNSSSQEGDKCLRARKVAFNSLGNVYVQHLTGTNHDLGGALIRLSFMETLEVDDMDSLAQLQDSTGLPINLKRLRRASNHSFIGAEVLSLIQESVKLDMELYSFHKRRLANRMKHFEKFQAHRL